MFDTLQILFCQLLRLIFKKILCFFKYIVILDMMCGRRQVLGFAIDSGQLYDSGGQLIWDF